MSSNFKDIVDINKWQDIQDHFSEVLKVGLCTLDKEGLSITKPSMPLKLCDERMRSPAWTGSICNCRPRALERFEAEWKEGYVCPGGMHNFFIPLRIKQKTLAYFAVGPVILGKRREESFYRLNAEKTGIDPDEFLEAIKEIKVFSFYGIKSVIELFYDIGTYICELSHQDTALKGIFPDAPNMISRIHDFYFDKLLEALLEVSFNFTGAERGSIMLIDESQKELYIKVAKGLKKEIIAKARSKIGEGIAGIIAQEDKPIFIGERIKDPRISSQLNNPEIKYSIGIPIKANAKILGVLNLGTSKDSSDKFTSESVETVDRLRQLVETVLSGIS